MFLLAPMLAEKKPPLPPGGAGKRDWRQELRSRVRNDQEEAERRIARVDSPSWRTRLEAVKAQMEDSSNKVEMAEQEMRRAVSSLREEQRTAGAQTATRQRSLLEMQELIHGLREEQQAAQLALHTCQAALRHARGTAVCYVVLGGQRSRLGHAWAAWARTTMALMRENALERRSRLEEHLARERVQTESLSAQVEADSAQLQERANESQSLRARISELQETLTRGSQTLAAEASEARQRQLGELRAQHQLQLAQTSEEHEDAMRRTWRRAQRARDSSLSAFTRTTGRRLLCACWIALRVHCAQARMEREAAAEGEVARTQLTAGKDDLQSRLFQAERNLEEARGVAGSAHHSQGGSEHYTDCSRSATALLYSLYPWPSLLITLLTLPTLLALLTHHSADRTCCTCSILYLLYTVLALCCTCCTCRACFTYRT